MPHLFRYTLRSLSRNPRFAAISILTLMLGIGVCTGVFSVVYAVMLKPLPYRNPDGLCVLWKSVPKKGLERDWTSYPSFKALKENNHAFGLLALVGRSEVGEVIMQSIRAALGAGRIALLKQLLIEAITIFLIVGALGTVTAVAIIKILRAVAP